MPDAPAILALLWRASWQAGVLVLLVLALRYTLRDRLPATWRSRLWGLVFLRLLLPALPASPLSLFNLLPPDPPLPASVQWPTVTVVVRANAPAPVASTPELTPPVADARPSAWPGALLATWLCTAAALAIATMAAHVRFARRVGRSTRTVPAEVADAWRFAAGGRRAPALVVTDAVSSPALFGLFRGRLLLPPNLWDRLSPGELRLVFQHELAHVRRRDLAMGWITVGIRCVYWFHPLVWVAVAARRTDAEAACDDAVLSATDEPLAYGRTLLAVAGGRRVPALGMADGRADLRRRLARVAAGRRKGRWSTAIAAGLTAVVGCATLTQSNRPANVTRTYSNFWPPDYNDVPVLTSTPKTPAPLPPPMPGPSVADAIRQSITPTAWGHGGAAITVDGVSIHVTAPEETQAQIERMIADRMVNVSVAVRIVSIRPSQVRRAGLAVPEVGAPVTISATKLAGLVRIAANDLTATTLTAPRLTLFSGQHSVLIIKTDQAYVSGLTPVITPTAARFDRTASSTPAFGMTMAVAATATPDRKGADLATRVVLDRLRSMDHVEMTATVGRSTTKASYQVPHHYGITVDANVRVPSGGSVWTRAQALDTYGKDGVTVPATRTSADEPETFVIWTVKVLPAHPAELPAAARPSTLPTGRSTAAATLSRFARPIPASDEAELIGEYARATGSYRVSPGLNRLGATQAPRALPPGTPTPDGRGVAMQVPTQFPADTFRRIEIGSSAGWVAPTMMPARR